MCVRFDDKIGRDFNILERNRRTNQPFVRQPDCTFADRAAKIYSSIKPTAKNGEAPQSLTMC
jgi:hypothetical protein